METAQKILKKLEERQKEEGTLPLLLKFYRRLLQVQSRVQKSLGKPEFKLSPAVIQQRFTAGQPLIGFPEIVLDYPRLREVFVQVMAVFAKYPELFGEIPEKLRKPGAGRRLTQKAVKAWFTGGTLPPALLENTNENLMQAIMQATLKPFLANYSQALIGLVDRENWRQGYCPICGGWPDIAYLDKERGSRWLLCSRCDTEWVFQRLECPYCRNKEQNSLSFFTDEEELYRLYVCERCKCYLKTVDTRKTEPEVPMPLARLDTIDLDVQARQRGYSPCPKPNP